MCPMSRWMFRPLSRKRNASRWLRHRPAVMLLMVLAACGTTSSPPPVVDPPPPAVTPPAAEPPPPQGPLAEPVPAPVTAGEQEVAVTVPGFESVARRVEVEASERMILPTELHPLPVSVTFLSTPPGARIRVDAELLVQTTPAIDVTLEPGYHTIELLPAEERYKPVMIERQWQPAGRHDVDVTFELKAAHVRFVSDRAWEQLELDAYPIRIVESQWFEMTAGRHHVVTKADRYAAVAVFDVEPGARHTEVLAWRLVSPDPARYALLPAAAKVMLGSPNYPDLNPPRTVEMEAYWIGRTEVTIGEYRACVEAGSCVPPVSGELCNWGVVGRDNHPVNCVSGVEAEVYARWLSSIDGLEYRLPTPEEWERAARGVIGSRFPWGDSYEPQRCNGCDSVCPWRWRSKEVSDGWPTSAPVASLRNCRGSTGIYDMVGNVSEWCREANGRRYGIRGGSWGQMGTFLDPAFVAERPPHDRQPTVGFRLVVHRPRGFRDDD